MTKKVLILEDHQTLASMLKDLFIYNGWQATIAINGREGLEQAQQGGWTAIITDLKMPQMDGMQFLNALYAHPPKIKNGPIVVYSNFAYEYSKDEALARGAADFIAKDTMTSSELVRHIEHLITQHQ